MKATRQVSRWYQRARRRFISRPAEGPHALGDDTGDTAMTPASD